MPATRNIQASILFALPFIGYQPANISNGEPAMQSANLIKQTILGPPFKWPWNRTALEIVLEDAQDYLIDVTDFGYLEQAWITEVKTGEVKEITIKTTLAADDAVQRPQSIAVELQDNEGITLRLNTVPDKPYVLSFFYQRAATVITSLASTWAPIPDNYAYVYDWGFLALLSMITKDVRLPIFSQKFVSHLLGAQDGLTATQRNIFIGDWLSLLTQAERAQASTQQGVQARSAT